MGAKSPDIKELGGLEYNLASHHSQLAIPFSTNRRLAVLYLLEACEYDLASHHSHQLVLQIARFSFFYK